MKWIAVSELRPPDGQLVDWISPNGSEVTGGKYVSGLWYLPTDFKSYADKMPVFWRKTNPPPATKPARTDEGTRA